MLPMYQVYSQGLDHIAEVIEVTLACVSVVNVARAARVDRALFILIEPTVSYNQSHAPLQHLMIDKDEDKMSEQIDRLGVVAGSLCAVHCALAALIPTALSALGLGLLLSQEVEWAFTLTAIVIAIAVASVYPRNADRNAKRTNKHT